MRTCYVLYMCVCTFHKEKKVYKMKVTTVFQFWKECYFVFHMKTCIDKNKNKLFVLRKYVTIIIQVYTVSCPELLQGWQKKCYTPWVRLWVSKWRNEGQPGLYKSFAPTKYKVISFELYVVVTNYFSSVKNTSLYYADREQTNYNSKSFLYVCILFPVPCVVRGLHQQHVEGKQA